MEMFSMHLNSYFYITSFMLENELESYNPLILHKKHKIIYKITKIYILLKDFTKFN